MLPLRTTTIYSTQWIAVMPSLPAERKVGGLLRAALAGDSLPVTKMRDFHIIRAEVTISPGAGRFQSLVAVTSVLRDWSQVGAHRE